MEDDMECLAHLEVQIKFACDLGSLWPVNNHGVNWKFGPFEGQFCGSLGCDHDGKGEIPLNGIPSIVSHRRDSSNSIVMRALHCARCGKAKAQNARMLGTLAEGCQRGGLSLDRGVADEWPSHLVSLELWGSVRTTIPTPKCGVLGPV